MTTDLERQIVRLYARSIAELESAIERYDAILASHTNANEKLQKEIEAGERKIESNRKHAEPYLAERTDLLAARNKLIELQQEEEIEAMEE